MPDVETFERALRDTLVDHIDGKRVPFAGRYSQRRRALRRLITSGFLEAIGKPSHPVATIITDEGRAELARLLAQHADALTKAIDDYSDLLHRLGLSDLARDVSAAKWPLRRDAEIPALLPASRAPAVEKAEIPQDL